MRNLFLTSSGLTEKTVNLFSDGLGYLANPLMPHAEKESSCGEVSETDLIELADGQMVWIKGEHQEIL